MVEGPGCTRNGEKLHASVVGQRAVGVAGSAAGCVAVAIRGRRLVDVQTLGKQLWMIFASDLAGGAETAVRCHFGMAGSLHCGKPQTPPDSHGRKQLTLLILFESGEVRVHDSTAVLGDAPSARESVRDARVRDVCGPLFDADAARSAVANAPVDRMIADVLLDQSVLPG
eukprot:5245785-Prymnesium_polylepis.1